MKQMKKKSPIFAHSEWSKTSIIFIFIMGEKVHKEMLFCYLFQRDFI